MLFWHDLLFRDFVPLPYYAGNFRQDDPHRPCLRVNVAVGGIAGTPYEFTPAAMQRLFGDVQSSLHDLETDWARLTPRDRAISVAIATGDLVGSFIRIHPFINGNGRISRLLWMWALFRFGVPAQFVIFPRPAPPYAHLMAEAMKGNYLPLQFHVLKHLAGNPPNPIRSPH
jgi:fido (protein-threonine AMPylation protein)